MNPLTGVADDVLGAVLGWVTDEGLPYLVGFLTLVVLISFVARFIKNGRDYYRTN